MSYEELEQLKQMLQNHLEQIKTLLHTSPITFEKEEVDGLKTTFHDLIHEVVQEAVPKAVQAAIDLTSRDTERRKNLVTGNTLQSLTDIDLRVSNHENRIQSLEELLRRLENENSNTRRARFPPRTADAPAHLVERVRDRTSLFRAKSLTGSRRFRKYCY